MLLPAVLCPVHRSRAPAVDAQRRLSRSGIFQCLRLSSDHPGVDRRQGAGGAWRAAEGIEAIKQLLRRRELLETHRSYAQQAHDYYREQRGHQRLLAARVPRSLAIRAGTLAALGGASVLSQILAACAGGGAEPETTGGTSAEGSYKYSKFPYIEKYNWRNLPWGGTPYVDGTLVMSGSGANNWDMVRQPSGVLTSYGSVMDNLLNKRYGAGAHMERDEIEGHITDKWSHAPDYSYSDYHIRRGVRFHDVAPVNGRALTAEDVKYSLDAYRTEGIARAPLEIIDRIEVLPDKETVRVHLKRPVLNLDITPASGD